MILFLVDGHALAYRAYFAFIKNPLMNSRGENTSAIFGFTRAIMQLMKKYAPRYLAVVFDSEEETERHREYREYKAHRERMPDEMAGQLPVILELLDALGVPVVIRPGYEADDILATLARRAAASGMDVKIVSGDKDMFQLLSGRVRVIRPSRGTALEDEIGPEYVEKRFGLRPEQVVDLLALMGDSSDNIPGIRGVGEKTALKLLHSFGSLDAILNGLEEVKPDKLRIKIEGGVEDAVMSRSLVELKEVPLDLALEELSLVDRDQERLRDLLLRLEFHQILKELTPGTYAGGGNTDYVVAGEDDLEGIARVLSGSSEFVIDVETTSLDPMKAEPVGISFCTEPGRAWYVPLIEPEAGELFDANREKVRTGIDPGMVKRWLGPALSDPSKGKIGQNIKYDLLVLEAHGFRVEGVSFDTMIASYCLDPERRSHSLDTLALEFCRHRMTSYKELFPVGDRRRDIRSVPTDRLAAYSCEDADYTMRLKRVFEESLEESGFERLFHDIEMPLSLVLKRMEQAGVALDCNRLARLSAEVSEELRRLTEKIHDAAGESFNINSNKQLQRILFDKLGLPAMRRTKTGYSTDVDVLSRLVEEHEIAGLVLEHRQLSKLSSTYIDALPRLVDPSTGRIHTSFNQAVTATGRLSSSDPNLQNIPIRTDLGRKIRSAFVPGGGLLLMDADYSQVELRILAHVSGDENLVGAFRDGADIHTRTAAGIHGVSEGEVDGDMRALAKTINFGVVYGMGARGLSAQLGISHEEAVGFIEEYFDKYPGVKDFIERSKEEARKKGYAETLLGRRRLLPGICSGDGRARSMSERIAVNMPIQGTAADMIKIAMIEIDRSISEKGLKSRMILQVHDELVFEVPPEEQEIMVELVPGIMASALELAVPVRVDVGTGGNWLEAHP